MKTFELLLQDATHAKCIPGVTTFVGEDASGSCGILAGHARLMTNLPAEELLIDLTDHYLLAALHRMLYTSLMVENRHRVTHLEGAVKHMDQESEELTRQCNTLRQEEIIEEVEVILLSSAELDDGPGARW